MNYSKFLNQLLLLLAFCCSNILNAKSFYADKKGQFYPYLPDQFTHIIQSRSSEDQLVYNKKLAALHAANEMTFRVKNETTGVYDKVHSVDANELILPFPQEHYQKIVKSTGPLMRSLRSLLQRIYSIPNAQWTEKNLGISALPRHAQKQLIKTLKENIFYEPQYTHSSLIDYPFVPIVGFDTAIADPMKFDPTFFEYNSGTPSGISNNIQLLESLRLIDSPQFDSLKDYLAKDRTFKLLRKTIEDNAFSWTQLEDGISVIIGPGEFNAAHPDVSSISLFTGMPLVNKQDLYEDSKGFIRLNLGKGEENPLVSGIYSRADESFLFQSRKRKIAAKDVIFKTTNKELSKKLNLPLLDGVFYDYIYAKDAEGKEDFSKAVDIERDEKGNPQMIELADQFGRDPDNLGRELDLIGAVQKRRIYVSCLGGRTVDDKKIFEILAKYLAPEFIEDEDLSDYAHPPKSIDESEEIKDFINLKSTEEGRKKLAKYVIKATDSSGGDGIYILKDMTVENRLKIVSKVEENPDIWLIQKFKDVARGKGITNDIKYFPQVVDLRIYVMLDSQGRVSADPQSVLLRTATYGSSKTNTSAGGGYGVFVTVDSKNEEKISFKGSVLPKSFQHHYFSLSKRVSLARFVYLINQAIFLFENKMPFNQKELNEMTQVHRSLMEILGTKYSHLMGDVRSYFNNEITKDELYRILFQFRSAIKNEEKFPIIDLDNYIDYHMRAFIPTLGPSEKPYLTDEEREKHLTIKKYPWFEKLPSDHKEILRKYVSGDQFYHRVVVAEYLDSTHPKIKSIINDLHTMNGKVLFVRDWNATLNDWSGAFASASFEVNEKDGSPNIYIDLNAPYSLSSLIHEYQHFNSWKSGVEDLVKSGVPFKEASLLIDKKLTGAEMRFDEERKAVEEELRANLIDDPLFNRGEYRLSTSISDIGYITRLLYPYVESIRSFLHFQKWERSLQPNELVRLNVLLKDAIRKSLELRLQFFNVHSSQKNLEKNEYFISYIKAQNPFQLIFGFDIYQFQTDNTFNDLVKIFIKNFEELKTQGQLHNYKLNDNDSIIDDPKTWFEETRAIYKFLPYSSIHSNQ